MDHQAPLNGSRQTAAPKQVTRGAAHFARHFLDMVDMQWRLFSLELGELRAIVVWATAGVVVAVGLLLAALPTALIGLGFWLADEFKLSNAVGLLLAAAGAMVCSALLAVIAWWVLSKRSHFSRSRTELKENMATLRRLLASRDRTTD